MDDRRALVTGGSRGLGAATARLLAARGARVAVTGRDAQACTDVVKAITADGGRADAAPADVTDPVELAELHERIGDVNILVAFAGGQGAPTPSVDLPLERWRSVLEGNLTATFQTVTTFLPGMIAAGGGSVVTMASSAARQPTEANVAYAAAKAGIVMLTKHLAKEYAPQQVRVNCLAPSSVWNERMERLLSPEQKVQLERGFPLGRVGTGDDVAEAAAFLASPASSWITGVTLDLSGGRVIV